MKKMAVFVLTTSVLAASAVSATAALPTAHAASATRVELVSTSKGKLLANGRGFTLYMFTRDTRKHDSCLAIKGCPGVWPMLTTRGRTVAGAGVKSSLLGSIKLSNGKRQVTYAGHPLYRYALDSGPRSTAYVGFSQFGGRWYGVAAGGKAVK
jgi:predicted lipoprotein with Yx(FWY)xxD motif